MSRFMLNVVIRRRRRSYGAVGVLLEAVVPGLNRNGLLCLEFVRHNISLAIVSDRESGTTSPHNRSVCQDNNPEICVLFADSWEPGRKIFAILDISTACESRWKDGYPLFSYPPIVGC
jgi:hypothetical protein